MAGTWNAMAVEPVHEIGGHITGITQQPRETTFLFQCLSMALQQVGAVSFQNTMTSELNSPLQSLYTLCQCSCLQICADTERRSIYPMTVLYSKTGVLNYITVKYSL